MLIHAFIILKLAVVVIYGLNREPLSLIVLSLFWKRVLILALTAFILNLTFGLVVTVFIWLLVSFGREDWAKIVVQGRNLSKTQSKK